MLTEDQQTVFDWINDNLELPVYAAAYKGAVELLSNKSPGYIAFVSHAGRDLMNGLAGAVLGITRQQVQYVERVDAFKDDWKDEWGGVGFERSETTDETGHLIPNEICQKVKRLVDEHTEGRRRREEANVAFFTTFLDYSHEASIPDNLRQEWRQARGWFQAHAHLRNTEFEVEAADELEKCFQALDGFLYSAAASQLEQLRSLREILEETNQ